MDLRDYRRELDRIDGELTALFTRRMEIIGQIASYKKENGLPVLDAVREAEKLADIENRLPEDLRAYGAEWFGCILALSRRRQRELMDRFR